MKRTPKKTLLERAEKYGVNHYRPWAASQGWLAGYRAGRADARKQGQVYTVKKFQDEWTANSARTCESGSLILKAARKQKKGKP